MSGGRSSTKETPDGRPADPVRGDPAHPLHRVGRRRPLAALLHGGGRRRDGFHGDASKGEPSIIALANGWVTINVDGGPTADKPTVTLETPADPDRVNSFLNIRVADIHAVIRDWGARGAEFLTPPVDRGVEHG